MKVSELIELLKNEDPNAEVIQTGEHNEPGPFSGRIARGVYVAENTWMGEFYDERDLEEIEDDAPADAAIYLWPVN